MQGVCMLIHLCCCPVSTNFEQEEVQLVFVAHLRVLIDGYQISDGTPNVYRYI